MDEHEEYSVYANAPYLLHEGHSIEDVEKEILDYGLTGKIDKELTDDLSTTIVKDDKVIHSVRGTDPLTFKDLISDIGIVLSHPISQNIMKGLNTFGAIYGINFNNYLIPIEENIKNQMTKLTPEFYEYQLAGLKKDKQFLMGAEEGPQFSLQEWIEEVNKAQENIKKAKTLQEKETLNKLLKNLLTGTSLLSGTYFTNKYKEDKRINPEKEKLNLIKKKYPNKKIELAGHSLGSVVNVLGRQENLKTITFNPAPQYESGNHHPESKIYRIKGDPVSFFLSGADTEPVIELKGKEGKYSHSLTNFLPSKSNPLPQRELKEKYTKEDEIDYCRRFPNDPNCKIFRT